MLPMLPMQPLDLSASGRKVGTAAHAVRCASPESEVPTRALASIYAHALAMEQEAISRYREFAGHTADHGNHTVAELFNRLADIGCEHAYGLAKRTLGMALPRVGPGEYAWLDRGAPVREARELVFRLMTPRHTLEIALGAEERAKLFFDLCSAATDDEDARTLATEFAREQEANVSWVREALEHCPRRIWPGDDQSGYVFVPDEM